VTVLRSFAIAWHLQRTPAGWRAVGVTARKVAGTDPAAAC
jgi:hypothetical protein